ncbi:MAG: type II toxin-antitoxin system VapC family toxin [Nitrospiraceae bacterium]
MRLLLDTAAFLWWITDSDRLSDRARELLGDADNDVWFSAVSSWELVIKAALGRVKLPEKAERFIPKHLAVNGFQILPIHLRHTLRVAALPGHHRDPFDRLLVAQALVEGLTLLSSDRQLTRYAGPVVW